VVTTLLMIGAVQVGHSAPRFIDACQDEARISKCVRAHKHLVSARCLVVAARYKRL